MQDLQHAALAEFEYDSCARAGALGCAVEEAVIAFDQAAGQPAVGEVAALVAQKCEHNAQLTGWGNFENCAAGFVSRPANCGRAIEIAVGRLQQRVWVFAVGADTGL